MSEVIDTAVAEHNTPILEREVPLVFDSETPRDAMLATIRKYNDRFEDLPGVGYFSQLPERFLMYGQTVHVSALYADSLAWDAYQAVYNDIESVETAGIMFERHPDELIDPMAIFHSA